MSHWINQRGNEYSLCWVRVESEYRKSQVESKYEYLPAVLEYESEYSISVLEYGLEYRAPVLESVLESSDLPSRNIPVSFFSMFKLGRGRPEADKEKFCYKTRKYLAFLLSTYWRNCGTIYFMIHVTRARRKTYQDDGLMVINDWTVQLWIIIVGFHCGGLVIITASTEQSKHFEFWNLSSVGCACKLWNSNIA